MLEQNAIIDFQLVFDKAHLFQRVKKLIPIIHFFVLWDNDIAYAKTFLKGHSNIEVFSLESLPEVEYHLVITPFPKRKFKNKIHFWQHYWSLEDFLNNTLQNEDASNT